MGLPFAHEGGQFTITDGGDHQVVDWSGQPDPDTLRWVALFSDVDHAVTEVTSGARITLVYSLSRSSRPRTDPARDTKLAKLREAVSGIQLDEALMIACTRQIVADGTQPQSIDTLRGTDREIAEAFLEAGFEVAVRACIVGADDDGDERSFPDPQQLYGVTRLSKAIPTNVIASMNDIVSFTDEVDLEEYGEDLETPGGVALGAYVLDHVEMSRWVIRKRAQASVIYEGMYSETGYFGNEASMGHIYTLAALEVSKRS